MNNDVLPIDMDIIQIRSEIPKKTAQLSCNDESKAVHYNITVWGEKRMPIIELHKELCTALRDYGNV